MNLHYIDYTQHQNADISFIETRNTTFLPVVVHILYNNDLQNISDQQIYAQLEVLNKDYSMSNENFDNTPDIFKSVAANVDIQFCLASVDPDGKSTNGITRNFTNVEEIGSSSFYYQDNMGGKSAWNTDKYINIWVADMGESDILGFATMPGDGSPIAQTGILINYKYFGFQGDHMDSTHNLGRACTHEMGHFFGLNHIWGSLGSMCEDDDGCADTPLQDQPNFGCPDFPKADICTQDNGVMFMNFMDYTDDACQTLFTLDQKTKIWETLMNERSELLENSSMECIVNTIDFSSSTWALFPNPTSDLFYILDESPGIDELITVFNQLGESVLLTKVTSNKTVIQLSLMNPGVYFVKYKSQVKKLVISR